MIKYEVIASYKCRNCGLGNINFPYTNLFPVDSEESYIEFLFDTLPKTIYHHCLDDSHIYGLADLTKLTVEKI